MTQGQPSLLDDIGNAASGAGSEALAAIKNVGGGDAGGTVGRLVSAVAGRHGGFAPKVITSVTKHGIAGIERVEPLENVDRGYRAVAADANGLESVRTIIELDPREYDVTVTRDDGAGVVEFVQQPKPETETLEPSPPVTESAGATAGRGRPSRLPSDEQAGAGPVRTAGTRRDDVAEARAAAEKAKAEAEAEKARAEAETARAEAETAKARAHTERARAESRTGESLPEAGKRSPTTAQSEGGVAAGDGIAATSTGETESAAREQPAASGRAGSGVDIADVDPAIGAVSVAGEDTSESERAEGSHSPGSVEPAGETDTGRPSHAATELDGSMPEAAGGSNETADGEKWGLPDDAGASSVSSTVDPAGEDGVASPDAPLRTGEPLEAETVEDAAGGESTVVDDEFGAFVAAEPVSDEEAPADSSATESGSDADEGIGRWAGTDDESTDTGAFEF